MLGLTLKMVMMLKLTTDEMCIFLLLITVSKNLNSDFLIHKIHYFLDTNYFHIMCCR